MHEKNECAHALDESKQTLNKTLRRSTQTRVGNAQERTSTHVILERTPNKRMAVEWLLYRWFGLTRTAAI